MKQLLFLLYLSLALPSHVWASDDHGHDEHGEHEENETNHVVIDPEIAKQTGISVTQAKSGTLKRAIKAYGRLVVAPDNAASVSARFYGLVTDVYVNLGDKVKKGDRLAQVESNESLQRYILRAPIDGVVQHRHANVGEVTGNESLFRIVNGDTLWAEIKIFPAERRNVKSGQPVTLMADNVSQISAIAHLLPASNDEAFVIARVPIDNKEGEFAPGDMVSAQIAVEQNKVPLVVANRALQSVRNQTVVFVQEGNRYELRPVKLGRSDDQYAEVLSGLDPGEPYVLENSYLIKAELEKSGAAHHHH